MSIPGMARRGWTCAHGHSVGMQAGEHGCALDRICYKRDFPERISKLAPEQVMSETALARQSVLEGDEHWTSLGLIIAAVTKAPGICSKVF